MLLTRLIAAILAGTPTIGVAHPHLFVQAGVVLDLSDPDEMRVGIDWIYDDYFSLLLIADLGIDLDGDLILTGAEMARLQSAVTTWPADFEGDLEVARSGRILPLGEKQAHEMNYAEGRVTESHERPVALRGDGPVQIRVFDPYYYVAYELAGPVRIIGRDDCTARVLPADLDAARANVAALLDGRDPADVGADEYFPPVGRDFADVIEVTCAAPL